jgi:hypothetical protein
MRRIITLVFIAIPVLAGCDAWVGRRIDISGATEDFFSVSGTSSFRLASAVRQYAGAHGLSCAEASELPIECAKGPVRVWAVSTEIGAVVCYTALGVAFEQNKYEARADQLQRALAEAFGVASVSYNAGRCPLPPSASRTGSS